MASALEEIKHESPSLSPSNQIASQQQRIADIILKTAAIVDDDSVTEKDVEAEAQKVIMVANLMTEVNTQKLDQIEKKREADKAAAPQQNSDAPLSAEQQLDMALGVKYAQ